MPNDDNTQRPLMMSVARWCAITGLGRSTVYRMLAEGEVASAVIRGRRLIPFSEADRILAAGIAAAQTGHMSTRGRAAAALAVSRPEARRSRAESAVA